MMPVLRRNSRRSAVFQSAVGLPSSCSSSCSSAKSAAVPPPAHGASPAARARTTPPTPPYHRSAAAARPLPRTLPPDYFRRSPLVARAYQIAGEIPTVIAQQPCYCRCDRLGHRSLLDCYASDHGAG